MITYLTIAALSFIILTLVDFHRGYCANKTDETMGNLLMATFWPATLAIVIVALLMMALVEMGLLDSPVFRRRTK